MSWTKNDININRWTDKTTEDYDPALRRNTDRLFKNIKTKKGQRELVSNEDSVEMFQNAN